MKKKISNIYRIANKCGFSVKHKETLGNVIFAFKSNESSLNLFFEVEAENSEDGKTFAENVAHSVFLFSENINPHTETRKYLEKKGLNINQYTEIYPEMNALAWQIRNLWFSL